ncbi:MAG: hypothetical protein MAG551_02603 [Candidatus Scalindua arabica]|uniref:DUF86 domain-containing protein n=1 Tax=Candidatus Scalindua arabica TaxID=1127984 RepID=A0A942A3X2_9BACT|nr:hypothetical protein [Candidatus Scalindua arabica]
MRIEPDDVLLNKSSIIERCIRRIKEEYNACPELTNFTHLDALILNIERSCQAAVDMAMHITAVNHLGIPQTSSEAFGLLFKNNIIDKKLSVSLQAMTGFRNIAIHAYQTLDNEVIRKIAVKNYKDFIKFCEAFKIIIKE